MMNVTPMMTGIICSSRRMMYLPTPTPSHKGFGRASSTKHSGGPAGIAPAGPTLFSDASRACRLLHDLDCLEIQDTEGVDFHITDPLRPDSCGLRVPQRRGGEVLGQQSLGLLIQRVGFIGGLCRRCLGRQL